MADWPVNFHIDLIPEDEFLILSHLQTDQQLIVRRSSYIAGLNRRYRNWRLAGGGNFIRPPMLLSAFLFQQDKCKKPNRESHCDTNQ